MSATVLKAVRQEDYWRVEIAWPDRKCLFGKFRSQADAEKWIEDYRWLTERQEWDDNRVANDAESA